MDYDMLRARDATADELKELKRMTRQEIGRVSQRAQMVLLSLQRRTVPEVARIFDTSCVTVRFWLRRFDAQGPAGLYDAPRSGRRRKVTVTVVETIATLLHQDPRAAGYLATCWTVAMLGLVVLARLHVALSATTLRRVLGGLGLRWGRPRLAMPAKRDPAKAEKQWRIAQAVLDAGPAAVLLYADESRVQLLPLIRATWQWVGQQLRVCTPGTNVSRTLFGALEVRTGRWLYAVRERGRQEDFLAFLQQVLTAYPTQPVVLVVDNVGAHTARAVAAWVATQPCLQVLYLPLYCSHLNPVEAIWRHLKATVAANRLYGSMDALLAAVAAYFEQLTAEKALALAAA